MAKDEQRKQDAEEKGTPMSEDEKRAQDEERVALGFSGVTSERFVGRTLTGGYRVESPTPYGGEADATVKRTERFDALNRGELDDEVEVLAKAPEADERSEEEKVLDSPRSEAAKRLIAQEKDMPAVTEKLDKKKVQKAEDGKKQ